MGDPKKLTFVGTGKCSEISAPTDSRLHFWSMGLIRWWSIRAQHLARGREHLCTAGSPGGEILTIHSLVSFRPALQFLEITFEFSPCPCSAFHVCELNEKAICPKHLEVLEVSPVQKIQFSSPGDWEFSGSPGDLQFSSSIPERCKASKE